MSIILSITSLTMPAVFVGRGGDYPEEIGSLVMFLMDWLSPLAGAIVLFLFWCANPIYLFSICTLLNRNKKSGFYLSLIPCLIALAFTQMDTIVTSESGAESIITALGPGYFLWLSSFLVLSIGIGIKLKI